MRVWVGLDVRGLGLARRILTVLEEQAARQGYSRLYLTTGFRQPEAAGLYLSSGYRALFDLDVDPEVHRKLPFEKPIGQPHPRRMAEACCPRQAH
jgi:N-acetylglutamate synthase-like GNAT family acetyltransferase